MFSQPRSTADNCQKAEYVGIALCTVALDKLVVELCVLLVDLFLWALKIKVDQGSE